MSILTTWSIIKYCGKYSGYRSEQTDRETVCTIRLTRLAYSKPNSKNPYRKFSGCRWIKSSDILLASASESSLKRLKTSNSTCWDPAVFTVLCGNKRREMLKPNPEGLWKPATYQKKGHAQHIWSCFYIKLPGDVRGVGGGGVDKRTALGCAAWRFFRATWSAKQMSKEMRQTLGKISGSSNLFQRGQNEQAKVVKCLQVIPPNGSRVAGQIKLTALRTTLNRVAFFFASTQSNTRHFDSLNYFV